MRSLSADEKLWIKICAGLLTLLALLIVAASNPEDRVRIVLVILGVLAFPFLFYAYMWVLPVAIHELGHLLTAFVLGFKVTGLKVCFMTWKRVDKITRFSLTASYSGGHVLADLNGMPRWKLVALFASGPITNFIFAIGLFALLRSPLSMNDNEQFVVFAFMCMNLATVASSFSKHRGKMATDGEQLRFLLSRDSATYFRIAKVVKSWADVPPRDWDIESIERIARKCRSQNILFWIEAIRCEQLCDRGDAELERAAREIALAKRADVRADWRAIVDNLLLESASFFAVHDGDIVRAKELLDEVKCVAVRTFPTARRALISINLVEGNLELALMRINRAESKVLPSSPFGATELDWIRRLKRRIVAAVEARDSAEFVAE